jgi:hypothetical protein
MLQIPAKYSYADSMLAEYGGLDAVSFDPLAERNARIGLGPMQWHVIGQIVNNWRRVCRGLPIVVEA